MNVVWGTTDYMDPGLSYRLESWQLFQDTYLGLVYKAHVSCLTGNCTKIMPGLATTIGTVTNGAKTYKFTLRKGLKYSNGEPIKASDFTHTIIRDFNLNSPGIGFFSNIVGIDPLRGEPDEVQEHLGHRHERRGGDDQDQPEARRSPTSSTSSRFRSRRWFLSSTPHKDTENPPPAANGPYYIASYNPSKSFVLKRNPHWTKNEIPGIPNGNPDKIDGTMTDDLARSAQLVASGPGRVRRERPADRPAPALQEQVRRARSSSGRIRRRTTSS